GIEGPVEATSYEVAEMVKYAGNCFHAVKVAFANEVGVLCKSLGVDSHEVMALVTQDTKLNASSAYLTPGFAFGGSCLPKDLRAIGALARRRDLAVPLLTATLDSNRAHVQRVIDQIISLDRKNLGFLGLSFKPGTDDLRESPIVTIVETMIGKG